MEVYFQSPDVPGDTVLGDVPEIWILGAAVMIDQNDNGRVEEHWPYMELYHDLVDQGIVTDEQFSINYPQTYSEALLDLPYAGFIGSGLTGACNDTARGGNLKSRPTPAATPSTTPMTGLTVGQEVV